MSEQPDSPFSLGSRIYYLQSILRQLDEISTIVEGPSIGSEILADNRDWLDCYIDTLRRESAAPQRDMQEVGG